MELNKHYNEQSLGTFIDDINSHLALQMTRNNYISQGCHRISVSECWVNYSAFEEDELNSIQKVLILLVIAVSNYDQNLLIEHWVVDVPQNMLFSWISQAEWGDLFEEIPITSKIYCLHKAYHLLTKKLSIRNTPLFRLLYICTCLELWRQKISPEMIAWPMGKDVHWGDLIIQVTGNFSWSACSKYENQGFWWFIGHLKNAVEQVSKSEVPENILRHFYSTHWWNSCNTTSLVQSYLHKIMSMRTTPPLPSV
jgi:hypothetical protein